MSNSATTGRDPDQLLDIRQAAHFLNVSVVSVRRYTDSGILKCIRVGRRPERRFRWADLEAFLAQERERADAPPAADAPHPHPARVILEGIEIDYGNHLCQLYEGDNGRAKMAVPFIADGLVAGDGCFLVASEPTRGALLNAIGQRRDLLDSDIESGRLRIVSCAKSGNEMLERLEHDFSQAIREGYNFLRLLGDMAWFFDAGLDSKDLVDFEMRYDRIIGHSYPVVSLCLYDARRFTGVDILRALKSHEDTFNLPLSRFLTR